MVEMVPVAGEVWWSSASVAGMGVLMVWGLRACYKSSLTSTPPTFLRERAEDIYRIVSQAVKMPLDQVCIRGRGKQKGLRLPMG